MRPRLIDERAARTTLPAPASNRQTSTAVACSEKRAKLTPRPSKWAPSGAGTPSSTAIMWGVRSHGGLQAESAGCAGYSAAAAAVGASRSMVRKFSSSAKKLRAHQSTSSRVMRSTIGFQRATRSAFGM